MVINYLSSIEKMHIFSPLPEGFNYKIILLPEIEKVVQN